MILGKSYFMFSNLNTKNNRNHTDVFHWKNFLLEFQFKEKKKNFLI